MNLKYLFPVLILIFSLPFLSSCEDETTTIGSVISSGEVDITIETIPYELNASAVRIETFDSKTGNLMIGNIYHENYGTLDCSFITKLMCATSLNLPKEITDLDDITERVDSCKLIMGAQRNDIIGDSLAPQQLTVYKLIKELPSSSTINNSFDISDYYNPSNPFAVKNYTVSAIAGTDSTFYNNSYVDITVDLPLEFGKEIFKAYQDTPQIFEWPQTMAKDFLPGLYFKSTFGNGCVANISTIYVGVFYYTEEEKKETNEDGETTTEIVHKSNLAVPFTVSPEVLSSNNITYSPSRNIIDKNTVITDGEVVVTTPGGYIAEFEFPAYDLIERFNEKEVHLSIVNDMILSIPAEPFDKDSGIGMAPNLLLIKQTDYEEFFAKNKIPDNLSSFTGVYDPAEGEYVFASMRNYFINLLNQKVISPEDIEFVLVPVEIETETTNNYYSETTYVTKCVPFTSKPTMTLLKTNKAEIVFSFSTQMIN